MDFGVVGLDNNGSGLLCSDNTTTTISVVSDAATETNKQKLYRSEDDWKGLKVAKTISDLPKSPLLRSNSLTSGQQMLSFSAPNSQTVTTTLPYYHYPSSYSSSISYTTTNPAGYYGNGGLTPGSMQGGVVSGGRGPFTPSQWMELEHQALIYKYINANIPIPSYLLTPIRKALDSAGFSLFSGLRTNSFGWGAFHLGFSNSNDPEPGRCRRTDGKKWRCSRDAIADHKYCERHMNRGRHRSRKPVEGQSGHSVSGTTNNTNTVKLTSASAAVVPGGGASNNPDLSSHHQLSNLQKTATSQSSAHPHGDRNLLNKANPGERYQETAGLSIISPAISMKENHYSIPNPKQQNPYVESSRGEFGQVCSDSLLNPLNRSSSLVNSSRYGASDDINDRESKSQHGLRHFMDDWPNSRPERSWSDIEMHSERTQLSISIPMAAASDFMSSTSSPTNDKIATSPLRLSREFQMGLGVGNFANERKNRQANWIPISWESSSLGGPLGEVLHSTNNSSGDGKNAAALNFMSEGWDSCPSPQLASSPTGVLQKAALVYLSNSSAGSSPRAVDNGKMIEGSSLCSGVSGSTLMNPALNSL